MLISEGFSLTMFEKFLYALKIAQAIEMIEKRYFLIDFILDNSREKLLGVKRIFLYQ